MTSRLRAHTKRIALGTIALSILLTVLQPSGVQASIGDRLPVVTEVCELGDVRFLPSELHAAWIHDVERITTFSLSFQSKLHKKLFKAKPARSGVSYCKFLDKNLKEVFFAKDWWDPTVIAFNTEGDMVLTNQYFREGTSAVERVSMLIHEARHSYGSQMKHALCPKPFLDENGEVVRSVITGKSFEGTFNCDEQSLGSYGVQLIWLDNISRFCTNCSDQERADARELYSILIKRITNPESRRTLLEDALTREK